MLDRFKKNINYLRISVTDKCNFRCVYCMPAEGVPRMKHEDILSFDEIVEFTKHAVKNGIDKVRITGGEPLVRRGIIDLMKMIGKISGIEDFALTTNGVLLPKFAKQLVSAGIKRVNISLDTLNPVKFKRITRVGDINDVYKGIEAAKEAGLNPIKINCVIKESPNEPDAKDVAEFCEENNLQIRYIREMDLEKGYFWKVKGGSGGDCSACNRLRLTSDGKIKPCLFSELEYDIKKLGVEKSFSLALNNKPESGTVNKNGSFNLIGG